jgi:hypothetical protein
MFQLFTRKPRRMPLRRPTRAVVPDEGEGAARGCGWFDSSHDLRRGLWAAELLSSGQAAGAEVFDRLHQLRLRVHHERPVLRDRLAQRPAGHDEQPRSLGAGL